MSKKFFTIIAIVVILVIIITSVVYFVNAGKSEGDLNEKTEEELKYISKEIVDMLNTLNNISFSNSSLQTKKENTSSTNNSDSQKNSSSEEKSQDQESEENTKIKFQIDEKGILNSDLTQIDWEYLKYNSEKLYQVWTISIIDLHSLNVNNEDILNFSSILDLVTFSTKNEDKSASLNNLASLYSYMPKFLEQINSDTKKINIENTKSSLINSYVLIESDNWDEVKKSIQTAISYYMNIINVVDENSNYNKNKVTKIYVLLNELNNATILQDKDIYYIKYKNVMDELVSL